MGVRDNNEASWTQVVDVLEFMSDRTSVPILLDGDTGYGNFNNARRLVAKLEQRGVAGVCIEDKLFPKTNSFVGGERQPLADIDEFCGKLKAMKDSQTDPDFNVVARVESFIAGWGLETTLERAHAYREAGADAVLIHSKRDDAKQIRAFMEAWDNAAPVVIVPTTYHTVPTQEFADMGVSLIIWANHTLRASVTAMQQAVKQIKQEQSLKTIEQDIVGVSEIFRLQRVADLSEAERSYLPRNEPIRSVILAASRGPEFGALTEDKPKAMIELGGKPILRHIQDAFTQCSIKDMTVVVGYKPETVHLDNIKTVDHPEWEQTGNAYSLYKAIDQLEGPVVISYGDLVFEPRVLTALLDSPGNIVLSVDTSWSNAPDDRSFICSVRGDRAPSEIFGGTTYSALEEIGYDLPHDQAHGEWIGMIKLTSEGSQIFAEHLRAFFSDAPEERMKATLIDFIGYLREQGVTPSLSYSRGHWFDLDGESDLRRYDALHGNAQ